MPKEKTITHKTPLYDWHINQGAKMVEFAGYHMPLHYQNGILREHKHTREQVSLFDVSHMGQAKIFGDLADKYFEQLVPGNIVGLENSRLRYTQFTNDNGGIIDDLVVTKLDKHLSIVVNASRKQIDYHHISEKLGTKIELQPMDKIALLALQGPYASNILANFEPQIASLPFMSHRRIKISGIPCGVSRCGYTGEDGYEIAVEDRYCNDIAELLVSKSAVKPAGLGARDTLRLEAGLCLYGNDIDENTTPIEAGLKWSVGLKQQEGGGFLGDSVIIEQIKNGPKKIRVGILPVGRMPARQNTIIFDSSGKRIGLVTSGGYGPTLNLPVSMGYVETNYGTANSQIKLGIRDKLEDGITTKLPFVPQNYYRAKS